jgi:protein-tyrosine phosphatase
VALVPTPAAPTLEGVSNFRDLGGATGAGGRQVRTGRIFRSGHLAGATDADVAVLAGLGIRTVIDFRGPIDIAHEGEDRMPAGADRLSLPMFDPATTGDIRTLFAAGDPVAIAARFGEGRAFQAMKAGAIQLVTHPERCEQFGAMLRCLAGEGGTPALLHCSAGKDRTGWASSLVLLSLGVDEGEVIAHYLESNARLGYRSNAVERMKALGVDPDVIVPFVIVHEDYVRASLTALDETWGGIDGYLHEALGLDDDLLEAFRQTMLV